MDADRHNHLDVAIGANEANPYNPDTDGDTFWDGAEPSPFEDTDNATFEALWLSATCPPDSRTLDSNPNTWRTLGARYVNAANP